MSCTQKSLFTRRHAPSFVSTFEVPKKTFVSEKTIKVLIVDDHQVLIDGIKSILSTVEDIVVVAEARRGQQALQLVEDLDIDLVLLDINMPEMDGMVTCKRLLEIRPQLKVIALTMHQEYTFIQNMLDQGAHGYLLKSSGRDEIILAIQQVHNNRSYLNSDVTTTLLEGMRRKKSSDQKRSSIRLTNRENEVLHLIVKGLTTSEIASKLFVSPTTAETHRKNLLRKLDVRNTAGLVRVAYEKKLLER